MGGNLMHRETELHAYLGRVADRSFEAGRHDCALFAAGWVDHITGSHHVATWSGKYKSLPEGRQMLRRDGLRSLRELAEAHLKSVGGWMNAQPGDVTLIKDQSLCFGIVGSGGVIHVLQPERGLDICPLSRAWEVFRP